MILALTPLFQSAPTPAPPELVQHLVANAELYRATLPSLTASEAIHSEASYLRIIRDKADATGTFRAVRAAATEPLNESREITQLNGKPVDPASKPHLPTSLFGGFGRFQEMFFTPAHSLCYTFTQLPDPGPNATLQIAIAPRLSPDGSPVCADTPAGVTGLARVDAASGQLTHLERTVPDAVADAKHLATFAYVDLAPTRVGEATYWLPTVVEGSILNGKIRGRFVAHYSNYHRYAATITVLPGVSTVPATADPPPAAPPAPPR